MLRASPIPYICEKRPTARQFTQHSIVNSSSLDNTSSGSRAYCPCPPRFNARFSTSSNQPRTPEPQYMHSTNTHNRQTNR